MTDVVYAHRPSKDVTRQIFVDCLYRVVAQPGAPAFQYVGFGALEFIDFDMVHRVLGIDRLTSIEKAQDLERYRYNKPFRCISLEQGDAKDALTRIDWSGLSIVWLDYECTLNQDVLSTLEYLCSKLTPGSVLAVTLNAHPGPLEGRLDRFEANVSTTRVPNGIDDDRLGDWGWAAAQQQIAYALIRNRLKKRPDQAAWWQMLNIHYQDNARMQLFAGIVSTHALRPQLESLRLDLRSYYRPYQESLLVKVPYLTNRERSALEQKLPFRGRRPQLPGVTAEDIKQYADYYRWMGA